MKSLLVLATLLLPFSASALTNAFCAKSAAAAAVAVANVNATVSEVADINTADLKKFKITLSDASLGKDTYIVTTSGGHECTVYSVVVRGEPTRIP